MGDTFGFIDLFAGAGGLSLGFELAGARPLYAVECDKWAALTYRTNHPHVKVEERDITELSDGEISQLRSLGADLLVGGPPCQGFSHSNLNRDPKDPRNSLFQEFIRFMKILRPRAVVIENVPGLLRTKTAAGEAVISVISASFDAIGYDCCWQVLEASSFGVPQQRQRLFIVGIDRERPADFIWPVPTHEVTAQPSLFGAVEPQVTLWDAISDLPQCTSETYDPKQAYISSPRNAYQRFSREGAAAIIHNHEPMRHTARIVERFAEIKFGSSEADVRMDLRPRKRGSPDEISDRAYDQNSRRQHPDRVCNTVVASSHTNFIHPYLNRNFTVRELMRIQSFPDRYVACGKRAVLSKKLSLKKGLLDDIYLDQRSQIGNAVPPLLARALANAVLSALQPTVRSNAA